MEAWHGIALTGGRNFFRAAGLLVRRVAALRGTAYALLGCAFLSAGLGLCLAQGGAAAIRANHLALLDAALACEVAMYEAAFHASMFGASGDMASYSAARISLAAMRGKASSLASRLRDLPEGAPLGRDMDAMGELILRFDRMLEKKRTIAEAIVGQKERLRRTAGAIGESLLDMQTATAAPASAGNARDERARLLLLNEVALALEEATGRALAAGGIRSSQELAAAQATFAERWGKARDAVIAAAAMIRAADAREAGSGIETLVGSYRDTLRVLLVSLEESERLDGERTRTVSRLMIASRAMVDAMRAGMREAAGNVSMTLTVSLSISIFLTLAWTLIIVWRFAGRQQGDGSANGRHIMTPIGVLGHSATAARCETRPSGE